jgi:hypothetical protein
VTPGRLILLVIRPAFSLTRWISGLLYAILRAAEEHVVNSLGPPKKAKPAK